MDFTPREIDAKDAARYAREGFWDDQTLGALLADGLRDGAWLMQYLRSFSGTIPGGTSEIQRNIIAERVLGLPR